MVRVGEGQNTSDVKPDQQQKGQTDGGDPIGSCTSRGEGKMSLQVACLVHDRVLASVGDTEEDTLCDGISALMVFCKAQELKTKGGSAGSLHRRSSPLLPVRFSYFFK